MKTKFILHGGIFKIEHKNNRDFFLEMINSVDLPKVKILCVYFARPRERWEKSFEEDQKEFLFLQTKKELEIETAVLEKEKLLQQLKNADVIYLGGGRNGCLKETLQGLGNFRNLIEGKVVAGSSAGVNALSQYYFSSGAWDIKEGLGILPIKTFCHFKEEYVAELAKLENYKEKLPIYKIPEEKYIVINI